MTDSPVTPAVGGTIGHIASLAPGLVPAERRVAEVLVRDPQFVSQASAADVAQRAGTSAATVVRTCKSLGLTGFQNVRLLLVRDLAAAQRQNPVTHAADGTSGIVNLLLDTTLRDLPAALSALDIAQLEGAARTIADARRVLVVANGGSAPPAQSVLLQFIAAHRPCEFSADAIVQQVSASSLGEGDVCLAVSSSGTNALTLKAVEAAHQAGATVIALTSYARSRMVEVAKHRLIAGSTIQDWSDGAVSIAATQMLVLTALSRLVGHMLGNQDDSSSDLFRFIADSDEQIQQADQA